MSAKLITQALAARTVADVDSLEHALERELGGGEIRFLGDRQTNWSALSSPVDPQSVIFERVTNAWDALIEQAAETVPAAQRTWSSPAEAARALLRVPAGEPAAMPTDERNELAARTLIQVLDSEDALIRPTLGFRDWGIGLTPAQMPTTILSLEGSNKLHKRYLHGVFGKGSVWTLAVAPPWTLEVAPPRVGCCCR